MIGCLLGLHMRPVKKIAANGKNLHWRLSYDCNKIKLKKFSEENCRFRQIYSVSNSVSNLTNYYVNCFSENSEE